MHKGTVGIAKLNARLHEALNPAEGGVLRGNRIFRVKDKVMQTRNNYEKPARRWPSGGEVFNGDVGRIRAIDMENQMVTVSFDGREVDCDFVDSDELALAYAVSVHKPQGSEYPAVLIPVLSQHYVLLQRNLIYTAVTRAKRLFVMVGTSKALAIAVRNDKTEKQYTYLRYRVSG